MKRKRSETIIDEDFVAKEAEPDQAPLTVVSHDDNRALVRRRPNDAISDDLIGAHLARLAEASVADQVKSRLLGGFTTSSQIDAMRQYGRVCDAITTMLGKRIELERANRLLKEQEAEASLERIYNDRRVAEYEAEIAGYRADGAEADLRTAAAKFQAANISQFVKPEVRQTPVAFGRVPGRPTVEQVRNARVRRQEVGIDDKLAILIARKVAVRQKVREKLKDFDLEPDERERLEHEIIQELETENEGEPNQKSL